MTGKADTKELLESKASKGLGMLQRRSVKQDQGSRDETGHGGGHDEGGERVAHGVAGLGHGEGAGHGAAAGHGAGRAGKEGKL